MLPSIKALLKVMKHLNVLNTSDNQKGSNNFHNQIVSVLHQEQEKNRLKKRFCTHKDSVKYS